MAVGLEEVVDPSISIESYINRGLWLSMEEHVPATCCTKRILQ